MAIAGIEAASYYAAVGFESGSAFTEGALLYGTPALTGAALLGGAVASYSVRANNLPSGSQYRMPKRPNRKFTFDDVSAGTVMARRQHYRSSRNKRRRTGIGSYRRIRVPNRRSGGYMGLENKFIDYEYSGTIATSLGTAMADPSPTALALNAIARGDGESDRDGRKVRLNSLLIQGHVNFYSQSAASPEGGHYARLLLVLDRQTNGAQMDDTDCLKNPSNNDLDISAVKNLQNAARFAILEERIIGQHSPTAVWNGTNSVNSQVQVPFKIYKKLAQTVHFLSGTTAAVSNIADYSLHLICIGSTGLSGNLQYVSRIRFHG